MSEEKFQLPNIPPLHVPQYTVVQVRDPDSDNKTASSSRNDGKADQTTSSLNADQGSVLLPVNFPKLCPSCSNSLLQFLRPLQLYVNQLVTLTSGMAEQCEHVQIINKMQELPIILQVPGGRTRQQEDHQTGQSAGFVRQRPDDEHRASSQRAQASGHSGHHNQQQQGTRSRQVDQDREPTTSHNQVAAAEGREQQQYHDQQASRARNQDGRDATGSLPQQSDRQEQEHGGGHKQEQQQKCDDAHQIPETGDQIVPGSPVPTVQQQQDHGQDATTPSGASSTNADVGDFEQVHDVPVPTESTGAQRPFAFVTIVYDNLSAINAIILCNSLSLSCTKQVRYNDHVVQIPFVALITGHVDPVLKEFLPTVFDEVRLSCCLIH